MAATLRMTLPSKIRPSDTRRSAMFYLLAAAIVAANLLFVSQHRVALGVAAPEWPVAVDLLLVVPLLYLGLKRRRGQALLAPLAGLVGLGVLAGSFIVPPESKQLWLILEPLRWVVLALILLAQVCVVTWVVSEIIRARRTDNLESAVHRAVGRWVRDETLAQLFRLEGRVWLYGLVSRASAVPLPGEHHYFSGRQGLNASNQLGFVILVGAEIPVAHFLIALFDPLLAAIVSALSLYGFLFLLAEYRAARLRPLSTDAQALHLRYGVATDALIPWQSVAGVRQFRGTVRRDRRTMRLIGMGEANVMLELAPGTRVAQLLGTREIDRIVLGVDDPAGFIIDVEQRLRHIRASI